MPLPRSNAEPPLGLNSPDKAVGSGVVPCHKNIIIGIAGKTDRAEGDCWVIEVARKNNILGKSIISDGQSRFITGRTYGHSA